MNEIQRQIYEALEILKKNISEVSKVFKECFKESGRGAFVTFTCFDGHISKIDYRTKQEALDYFDNASSKQAFSKLISNYNTAKEAVIMLVTDVNNASCFLKINLK
ncbi:MAG: hypothetical protein U9O87_04715 [Verrucomicrobiota bacterium]|nr:hypothetical protein [Verrucomicrobiota bacterium]